MRQLMIVWMSLFSFICQGQSTGKLVLRGDYSRLDSIQMTESYYRAHEAVHQLLDKINEIWQVEPDLNQNKKNLRKEAWLKEDIFPLWLGKPEKIRKVRRTIRHIHTKFRRNLILVVSRDDRLVCNRWTGAWAIPFGKIRIRLCQNFFNSPHLQEKIIIHELGHEAGILFHRNIHNCWSALEAARSRNNVAKRSTENYAWLAVSYLGVDCTY